MKNISIKIIGLFVAVFFLATCEKEIDLTNPHESKKNVINAIFAVDSTMEVVLYKSNLPLSKNEKFDLITDATIEIEESGTKESLIFSGGKYISSGEPEGSYKSLKKVEIGKTYHLTVEGKGIYNLKSSIKIPDVPNITNPIFVTTIDGDELHFTINDPAGEENFYEVAIYYSFYNIIYNDTDTLFEGPYTDQAYLEIKNDNQNPIEAVNGSGLLLFKDELFNGKNYPVKLSIFTVSNQYYEDEYIPEDVPKYGAILIDANLQISTINKGLYEYNLSVQKQQETVGSPFAEPTQIKSNIENGLGVFGARNTAFFPVEL